MAGIEYGVDKQRRERPRARSWIKMCNHLGLLLLLIASVVTGFAISLRWFLAARRDADRYEALAVAVAEAIVTSESRKEAEHIVEKTRFALGLERTTAALQIWSEVHEGEEGRRPPPRKPGT